MHKSKENANGSFSIGKTWDLNDLSAIESFTSPDTDPQKREWAGDTGFIVSVGKPYYWQAQADKEKKFFIASLVKIYGKYTSGNVPELKGFDPRELDQVLGSRRPPPSRSGPSDSTPSLRAGPGPTPTPPPSRSAATPPRMDPKPYRPDPVPSQHDTLPIQSPPNPLAPAGGIQPFRPNKPPSSPGRKLAPPNGTSAPAPAAGLDSARSGSQQAALRRLAGNNKSQDSVAASVSTIRSEDAASLPPRSRGGMTGPGAFGRFAEPSESASQVDLPDRKRPPMDPARPKEVMDNDLVPAPLMSQTPKREPPPRSTERGSPRNNSIGKPFEPTSPPRRVLPIERIPDTPETPIVNNGTKASPAAESAAPGTPPTETSADDDNRPGLGPMIKARKGRGDLAGTLWKAASAATAFKPRPGGAGERLRELQSKISVEGPDGITSVVPAPRRPEPKPETPKPIEPERKSPERPSFVPEVKVTKPNPSRPTSSHGPAKESKRKSLDQIQQEEEPRRLTVTGNDTKYLTALGIDTSVLADQTPEFARWLDHFGWVPGEQMRSRNFEEMKLDIDRELNKVQAGGWVVRFQAEDDRVEAIKRGLDVAITECDELDNLLTLYSVELSVSLNESGSGSRGR